MVAGEVCRECTHLVASKSGGADCVQAERMRVGAGYEAEPPDTRRWSYAPDEAERHARVERLARPAIHCRTPAVMKL